MGLAQNDYGFLTHPVTYKGLVGISPVSHPSLSFITGSSDGTSWTDTLKSPFLREPSIHSII